MSTTDGKARILVVEDEEAIREGLCDVLAYHGHLPAAASTGEDGLREALDGSYDLVVLDLMLPQLSGLDVCRRLRAERAPLPILMLTAKGSEDDIVRGFRAGADDYVTKPFSIRELVVRVEALLRRSGALLGTRGTFTFGPYEVDAQGLRAVAGKRTVELTRREVQLLALFVRERGRVVSRRILLQEVWEMRYPEDLDTRTVDVHIAKLRRKIDAADGPSLIATVRGAGYRFTAA